MELTNLINNDIFSFNTGENGTHLINFSDIVDIRKLFKSREKKELLETKGFKKSRVIAHFDKNKYKELHRNFVANNPTQNIEDDITEQDYSNYINYNSGLLLDCMWRWMNE